MRGFIYGAAIAGAALSLAACSGGTEEAAPADDAAMADTVEATDTAEAGSAVIDASTASAADVAAVEGVSEDLATAIVAGQPYDSVTALNARLLETLSEEEAAAVLEKVFVPVNLNSATREEIDLVPGMSDKMAHEFEEYRPYEDMAEFEREIGKYVDEAEVARFRNYVTL